MPEKLDRCVADVKAKGGVDNPWAVCNASIGKETKVQEKVNANRQVPFPNPPIKPKKVEPDIKKTPKGIGGSNNSSTKNPMNADLWKQILDSQLKRNANNTRYYK